MLTPDPARGVPYSQLLEFNGFADDGLDIVGPTSGGSLVVGGMDLGFFADARATAVRLDASGNVIWENYYSVGGLSNFWSAIETSMNDFVAVGWAFSNATGSLDVYAVRFDANGDVIWQRTYGGSDLDKAHDVVELPNDRLAIVGSTRSLGAGSNPDLWVLIVELFDGSISMENIHGTPTELQARFGGDGFEEGYTALLADPFVGDLLVAGTTDSFGAGNRDMWVLRLKQELIAPLWQLTYGGPGNESAYGSVETASDEFVLVGEESSFGLGNIGDKGLWLINLDANGGILWEHSFHSNSDPPPPQPHPDEIGWDITLLSSGRLLVAGEASDDTIAHPDRTSNDMILLDVDPATGLPGWGRFHDAYPAFDTFDRGRGVSEAAGGEILLVGQSSDPMVTGDWDWWTLDLDANGQVRPGGPPNVCEFQDPGISEHDSDEVFTQTLVQVALTNALAVPHADLPVSTSLSRDVRCTGP